MSSLCSVLPSTCDGLFDRVISKPIKRQVLLRTLEELLGSAVPPSNPADLAAGRLQGLRALLVDDNAVNQKLGQRLLEKLGMHVTQAWNGLEAIEHLRQHHFDVVLMDCQMPEMDGFEATRTIRRANSTVLDSTVPIIAMTANALSGDRQECLGAGMNDYIAKPIDSKRLLAVLETNCPRLKICDAGTVR
jgi:CheY-like chemotaxis protein